MCADGSPQLTYIPQEEETSPTITLEALLLSLFIDTHEERELQTFDFPVACIHASLPGDKVVHMKFKGEFVEIMCEVNPE